MEGGGGKDFLPPEPAGPDPGLTGAPDQPAEDSTREQTQAWEPPAEADTQQGGADPAGVQAGWQHAPPPGWGQQPPPGQQGWQQPPPGQQGWRQPPPGQQGWQQPPPGQQGWGQQPAPPGWGWQPPPGYPAWGYAGPPEPDNGAAVAGFVTSIASAAVLVMSFGFAGILTLIAAPFGIYYSRKGKQAMREGRTRKHGGLAQAGFVIGIVVLVLSVLAVVGAILFIIDMANDDSINRDGGGTISALSNSARLTG